MVKIAYLCDGRGCEKNCRDTGFDLCTHTTDIAHAKNYKNGEELKLYNRDRWEKSICHNVMLESETYYFEKDWREDVNE